jgi:hypothetical protein
VKREEGGGDGEKGSGLFGKDSRMSGLIFSFLFVKFRYNFS